MALEKSPQPDASKLIRYGFIVGDEDDRRSLCSFLFEDAQHLSSQSTIQATCCLIKNKYGTLELQSPDECEPLLLATAQVGTAFLHQKIQRMFTECFR